LFFPLGMEIPQRHHVEAKIMVEQTLH
jgi:hypothetical protein